MGEKDGKENGEKGNRLTGEKEGEEGRIKVERRKDK